MTFAYKLPFALVSKICLRYYGLIKVRWSSLYMELYKAPLVCFINPCGNVTDPDKNNVNLLNYWKQFKVCH